MKSIKGRGWRALWVGAVCALLAGWAQAEAFGLEGRLAVRDAERSAHLALQWQHAGWRDDMVFISPLGSVMGVLQRDGAAVRLVDAERRVWQESSPERLAERMFGFRVPVHALAEWIQGVVPADVRILERDRQGRVRKFADDGWIIEFLQREEGPGGRPMLLEAYWGEIRVRLKIDRWWAAEERLSVPVVN